MSAALASPPDPADDADRVLRERARALARPVRRTDDAGDAATYVIFRVGDGRYAVEAAAARGAVPLRQVAALPGVPAFVRGLFNHRGRVLPVVDLAALWQLPPPPGDVAPEWGVLVSVDEVEFVLVAQELGEVRPIPPATIEPLDHHPTLNVRHLRGLADGVLLLDLPALLPDLIVGETSAPA